MFVFFFFNLEKPCAWLNLICLYVYRPSRWHTSELICLVKNGKWFRRNLWERSDLMTFLLMFRGQNLSLSVSFFYDDQLSINILNYFTRFDCPWDYDSKKFRSFFMGRKGKRKQKFRLVIRYLVQDNITRPSLPCSLFSMRISRLEQLK